MTKVKLVAKRDFNILDFFDNEFPVMMGDELDAKRVGFFKSKKIIDDVEYSYYDKEFYSIPFGKNNSAMYDGEFVKDYFEILENEGVDD